ncbi:MAG: hypothetical protein IPI56_00080 [Elusimicrobia bacterium]|nr:hypothetical protein [Elusimicrobiota bacterium]
MTKWSPISLVLLMFLSGCFFMIDRNVTNDTRFSSVVGQTYETKKDLIAFRYRDKKSTVYIDEFSSHNGGLPSKDQLKEGVYRHGDYIIEGLVPSGTRYRVERIVEENHFEDSFLGIYAKITASSNNRLDNLNINVYWLLTEVYPSGVPQFQPDLVSSPKLEEKKDE